MGYQETMIKIQFKNLNKVKQKIKEENLDYLVYSMGYYFNPQKKLEEDDTIYLVVCGDRHPLADVIMENFNAKPIEDVTSLLEVLWDEFEYKELDDFEMSDYDMPF